MGGEERREGRERKRVEEEDEETRAMETISVARERGVDRGRIISPSHTGDGERLAEALLSSRRRFSVMRGAREREANKIERHREIAGKREGNREKERERERGSPLLSTESFSVARRER